ncbi:hypothetical protein NEHOM01_1820 [Nematocida homosporus]|uniref:uncharacterized protein n=1 Tax=Nematocida homosporus TaxID=1912981 RepID=UPI00222033F7|nr:uncharacterized protein NEHOM01_1820 [Nematocida homosporus]KAI5186954.1 hypothetical protein NEHOM01_1820 [Nematocida homosporus]
MRNQFQVTIRLAIFVILQCLCVLSTEPAGQLDNMLAQDMQQTNCPTLDDWAALDFAWAKSLKKHLQNNPAQLKHLSAKLATTISKYPQECFLKDGFYSLLFGPSRLERTKQVASNLLNQFSPTQDITSGVDQDLILDTIMLFAMLDQSQSLERLTNIHNNNPYKAFIENFTFAIRFCQHETPNFVDNLEAVCLGRNAYFAYGGSKDQRDLSRSPDRNKALFKFLSPDTTLIYNYPDLATLRSSPLIIYIHPLNLDLYMAGLLYTYDQHQKHFLFFRHNLTSVLSASAINIGATNYVTHFNFETAVRLRYAPPTNKYTIMASDEDWETITSVLSRYRKVDDIDKVFTRSSTKDTSGASKSFRRWISTETSELSESETQRKDDLHLLREQHNGITLFVGGISLLSSEAVVISLSILTDNKTFLVCILPLAVMFFGLSVSLLLLYITSFIFHKTRRLTQRHHTFLFLMGTLAGVLTVIVGAFMIYYSKADEKTQIYILLIAQYVFTLAMMLGFLGVRLLFNYIPSCIIRRLYYVFYGLAIVLAVLPSILCLTNQTVDARLLLKSQVLVISAVFFVIGTFIDLFGRRLDKMQSGWMKERCPKEKLQKAQRLIAIAVVQIALIGLAVGLMLRFNLLAEDVTLIPSYDPATSIMGKISAIKV